MQFFRIKDKRNGRYSTGGHSPRWTKKGKVWKSIGHVKTHLRIFIHQDGSYSSQVKNWELETIEVKETIVSQDDAMNLIAEISSDAKKKHDDRIKAHEDAQKLRRNTIAKLTPEERRVLGVG